MKWMLMSFTLGWSTPVGGPFDTFELCNFAKYQHERHATFMTRFECIQTAPVPADKK